MLPFNGDADEIARQRRDALGEGYDDNAEKERKYNSDLDRVSRVLRHINNALHETTHRATIVSYHPNVTQDGIDCLVDEMRALYNLTGEALILADKLSKNFQNDYQ